MRDDPRTRFWLFFTAALVTLVAGVYSGQASAGRGPSADSFAVEDDLRDAVASPPTSPILVARGQAVLLDASATPDKRHGGLEDVLLSSRRRRAQ